MIDRKNKSAFPFRIELGCIYLALLLLLPACSSDDLNPIIGSNPSESEVEIASFNLINQDRKNQGLPALTLDPQLVSVARAHSMDMRDRNFIAHVNPDGNTFSDRLRKAGVSFRIAGENLAVTQSMSDPASFANAEFLANTTHRGNILNRKFTRVGVGVARSGSKYWITQDFVGN